MTEAAVENEVRAMKGKEAGVEAESGGLETMAGVAAGAEIGARLEIYRQMLDRCFFLGGFFFADLMGNKVPG